MHPTTSALESAALELVTLAEDIAKDGRDELPVNVLELARDLRKSIELVEQLAAARARQQRNSWEVIGEAAGISKQAANKKWSRLSTQLQDEATPVDAQPAKAEYYRHSLNAAIKDDAARDEHVPGQLELPTETDTPVWVCTNCGTDQFPRVAHTDWCSRCHTTSDPEHYRKGSTCGHCGMGRHERCAFDPRSRTYSTGRPIQHEAGDHWQCACSLHHEQEPATTTTAHEPLGATLVVIACGKEKSEKREYARELYTGRQFRLARDAAEALVGELVERGEVAELRILSAEHGLLRPQDVVEPYERTITDPNGISDSLVAWQLHGINPARLIALTPKDYSAKLARAIEYAREEWGMAKPQVRDELAGRDLFEQRELLAKIKRLEPTVIGPR